MEIALLLLVLFLAVTAVYQWNKYIMDQTISALKKRTQQAEIDNLILREKIRQQRLNQRF